MSLTSPDGWRDAATALPWRPLIVVAAVADHNVAGDRGRLPWHAPDDLRHFKDLTHGHPVIMGTRTWRGLPSALPGRTNIVLCDEGNFVAQGATVARSLPEALAVAGTGPVFVIGGRRPWDVALPIADQVVLTRIHATFPGDTWFPALDGTLWCEVHREEHVGPVNGTATTLEFITYTRRDSSRVG